MRVTPIIASPSSAFLSTTATRVLDRLLDAARPQLVAELAGALGVIDPEVRNALTELRREGFVEETSGAWGAVDSARAMAAAEVNASRRFRALQYAFQAREQLEPTALARTL